MLRDEGVVVEAAAWMGGGGGVGREPPSSRERYVEIDRELRRIAKRKAALDVEQARWLREAETHRVWRTLGFSTLLEYLEDVFGYGPRTAKDRLRVAKELGELPELEAELRHGALSYSAARELTRVMTRATERQWLARARGKNLRDIEELVAGRRKGDSLDDPKDPALLTRRYVLELDARRDALLQQVRTTLEAERGEHLEDEELIEAMCMRVLAGSEATERDPSKAPSPAHQIVIRRCDDCARAWQQSRGTAVAITNTDLEHASCDAQIIRQDDIEAAAASGTRRPRPTLSIPAKTRDLVTARDQGRCRFPGCRATRCIEVHHIVHRAQGGGHEPSNLLLLCDGHHKLLHDGLVTITGRAPDQLVFMRAGTALHDARTPAELDAGTALCAASSAKARSRFDDVVKLEHATQALRQLGFKTRDAKRALEQARAHVGMEADIPTLLRAVLALQRGAAHELSARNHEAQATQALTQAGFSSVEAARAVAAACGVVGTGAELAVLIREALRHCR